MRSSRIGRIVAITATLGVGLVMSVPVGAVAGSVRPVAAASHQHPIGFFITGEGRVGNTRPAVLLQGRRGGQHIVTVRRDRHVTGNRGHVVYRTRRPGAKHWISTVVPGLHPMAGLRVEAHPVSNDRQVLAVVYGCDGVFATQTGARATRLPRLTLVAPVDTCGGPTTNTQDPPLANATDVAGGPIGVLLPDPARGNRIALWRGSARGPFTPKHTLPTADHFVPAMIVHDRNGGRTVVAVGYGDDGTHRGIYVTTSFFATRWSKPTEIATLNSAKRSYIIDAVAADAGFITVGLSLPRKLRQPLFTDTGDEAGEWTGAVPIPHSTSRDRSLRLAYNDASGHLHAAFTRINASSRASGIMTEKLLSTQDRAPSWTEPRFLTHGFLDIADQITFNANGGAVIGYTQR
jgi:hypothetical protein